MGVSYYSCESCGDSRYEEFVSQCSNCGSTLCDNCVTYGNEDEWFNLINENDGIPKEDCPFCSGSEIKDEDLLVFICNEYKIDLEEAQNKYLENLKMKGNNYEIYSR